MGKSREGVAPWRERAMLNQRRHWCKFMQYDGSGNTARAFIGTQFTERINNSSEVGLGHTLDATKNSGLQ